MKFLADAHVSRKIVAFVQGESHDCTQAKYLPSGMTDEEVLAVAVTEQRFLITHDKDFGELVFRDGLAVPGVLLVRAENGTEDDRVDVLRRHWSEIVARIVGHFITVTPERVRSRPLE